MNVVQKIERWGDSHHPGILDITRIALGVFLLLKGIGFMESSAYLKDLIENQQVMPVSSGILMALVYYVTFAHLVGGAMIAIGTLTRLSCIVQIPIVLAAVFLTDFFQSPVNAMAWPSIVALALLVLFTVIGSGPFSLDRYLAKWED
jgi:putative oxidoreductase